jgi:hypothetical protein
MAGDRRAGGAGDVAGDALPENYLDLYKLAVEMADRVSARRAVANSFFLAVNSGLVALVGGAGLPWYVGVAGVVFAVAWWALLRSYRRLNAAKFQVIKRIEERLPVRIFTDEWELLRPADGTPRHGWRAVARYRELGAIERIVPWVFAAINVAAIVESQ